MKKKTKSSSGAMELFKIGAGLAGLAAAAYFLMESKGKKEQTQVKSWAIKMKGDIIEKLKSARNISEPIYQGIIDAVAAKYEKELKSSPKEIRELAQDLKKHWKAISGLVLAAKSDTANSAKKIETKQMKKEKKSVKV
jgi:phytoene dehydrogenase-like protein